MAEHPEVEGSGNVNTGYYVPKERLPFMDQAAEQLTLKGIPITIERLDEDVASRPTEALVKINGGDPKIGLIQFWGRVRKLENKAKQTVAT